MLDLSAEVIKKYNITSENILNSCEALEHAACDKCGQEYIILLANHDAPYHERETDKCPCGNMVSFKSRWMEVYFYFQKPKEIY
ncbi:hypothetical protein [Bacillus cereus]|uniref:Uncharacterized protein n=1 Tax=Bacillus cereus TaxID=1396 RepID=A0AA44TEX1_BACCE|nr:hypothetical protein [Bacillus cereus]PFN09323.1 hypothetical protein COJ55_03430 [Bacillus cereus]PFS02032.1 hypothetical protein COK38_10160 [Bacillus cereus]